MTASQQRFRMVLFGVGFEGSFVILAWLLGWLLGQPPLERFHWSWSGVAWGVAGLVPMLLGALVMIRWPVGPLAQIKEFSEQVIRPLFAPCTLADLALISLLAGLGEEMLFRGVLQPAFARWLGPVAGLLLASALFGLLHPITGAYIVLAALIGLYLGCIYLLCDNLLPVVITHGLYDFVLLVYLLRFAPTHVPEPVDGDGTISAPPEEATE